MAELTTLEEKLAEVLGLAQAAQGATEKVEGMVEDEEIVAGLRSRSWSSGRCRSKNATSRTSKTAR